MTAIRLHDGNQEWERWNADTLNHYKPRHVPMGEQARYAGSTSLRQFYLDCEQGKWEQLDRRRGRGKSTKSKERQALNRWERYTLPADWPTGDTWPGPSLAFLEQVAGTYFDEVYERMETDLASATIRSTRSHLQVMFRHAERVKAVTSRIGESKPIARGDEKTRIYTPEEVSKAFIALDSHPLLKVAFRIALDAGPRAEDLFLLKRTALEQDAIGRWQLDFQARKTKKLQAVPLTKVALEAVQDLLASHDEPYLFPGLSSPQSKDPEKSYSARVRNTLMKTLLRSAGMDVPMKPWQAARATCNERFEAHAPGVGQFILGHEVNGVNARSYREPSKAVHEAVASLPEYKSRLQMRLF